MDCVFVGSPLDTPRQIAHSSSGAQNRHEGRICTTAFSGRELRRNRDSPFEFSPSCTVGVGNNSYTTRVRYWNFPDFLVILFASSEVGVGSNDEEPLASVGGSHVGSSYNHPFRIEPRFGKIGEHPVESESKVP